MEASSSRSRKPFSDCTNTVDAVNPSQSSSTSTKNSSSIIKHSKLISASTSKTSVAIKPSKTQAEPATGSSTTPSRKGDDKLTKPSAVLVPSVSTPPRTLKPSFPEGTARREVFEPSSVYVRRQSAVRIQRKEKEIAVPKSCFPAIKTRSKRDRVDEDGVSSLSKSCPVPNRKKRHQTTPTTSKEDVAMHALPQDFIEQQRAYFAEVDAFELSEEEVDALSEEEAS
ncbi:uncharacterized protein [Euphorbia lathyris]|uniref:uncharacterized protein n=1 Tax=Euphorbia lathyris TaxID=212925 RepID=UPI0033143677